jgi:hypothetical protein
MIMNFAIDLNYQVLFMAIKIGDIIPYFVIKNYLKRMLPAKFIPVQFAIPQHLPKDVFTCCLNFAKIYRKPPTKRASTRPSIFPSPYLLNQLIFDGEGNARTKQSDHVSKKGEAKTFFPGFVRALNADFLGFCPDFPALNQFIP